MAIAVVFHAIAVQKIYGMRLHSQQNGVPAYHNTSPSQDTRGCNSNNPPPAEQTGNRCIPLPGS